MQLVNEQIQHEHLRAGIKQELDRRRKIAQAAQVIALSRASECGFELGMRADYDLRLAFKHSMQLSHLPLPRILHPSSLFLRA